jgi:hypothetical protein
MANINGLISSRDVCATGAPDSNFYVRKGDPIVTTSPFQVISSNGNFVFSVSESNNGDATISTAGNINLVTTVSDEYINLTARETVLLGTGANPTPALRLQNENGTYYTTYNATDTGGGLTADHLETWAYPSGGGIIKCVDIAPNGQVNIPVQLNTNQILLAGKPVAKASKVAWVGLGGVNADTITIPANTTAQNVSANFAVVAGHTYRVTAQFRLECADNTDPNAIMYVNITSEPNASVESIGVAGVLSANTTSGVLDNTTCYSALFVPTASVATCRLIAGNTSTTDSGALKISSVGQPQDSPNILLEDLGIL